MTETIGAGAFDMPSKSIKDESNVLVSPRDLTKIHAGVWHEGGSPEDARFSLYEAMKSGVFATIQSLKSLPGSVNGQLIGTYGYYATGDCEPLLYKWDSASTATDDGVDSTHPGLVIQPTSVSGAGRWIAVLNGRVNVRWYGASPSESNNQPYIQRALREAISQDAYPKAVFIPAGSYTCTAGLLCKKDSNADGQPEAFSLLIEGEGGVPYGLAGSSILNFTHNDTFGIGIQLGKGIRIKKLMLDGMNNISFADPKAAFTSAESSYVINGCRDNSLSPYAGIAIDPFGPSSISAGNRYPGYSAEYISGHTQGGSTEIKVEDCRIQGFVTNAVLSPNGYTQNAEHVEFSRVWSDQCKVAFAIGQLQSRSVHIRDCISWGAVLRWIDGSSYGAGSGPMPYVHGGNIAGNLKYLIKCTGAATSVSSVIGLYAESLYSLGIVTCDSLSFIGCHFSWTPTSSTNASAHCHLSSIGSVSFKSCFLNHSANPPSVKSLCFDVQRLSYDDCTFDTIPAELSVNDIDRSTHVRSRFRMITTPSDRFSVYSTSVSIFEAPSANGVLVSPGTVIQSTTTLAKRWTIGGDSPVLKIRPTSSPATFTYTGDGVATFTADFPLRCQVGDVIRVESFVNEFGFEHPATGYISNVSGSVMTVSGLPHLFVSGSYWSSLQGVSRWHDDCIGDTTSGSNVITNVRTSLALSSVWKVGERISGNGIPIGTWVTARDNNAKTLTLSQNATATNTRVDLFDAVIADCRASLAAVPSSGSWRKGTVVDDSTGATNGWRCTASGTFGSGTEPTFVAR